MHIPLKIKPLNHKNTNNIVLEFEHNIVELLGRTTMRYTQVSTQTITKVPVRRINCEGLHKKMKKNVKSTTKMGSFGVY